MARQPDISALKLDDAARAGWLYYVAGNTQDEIARKMGISRQSAQRLVAIAVWRSGRLAPEKVLIEAPARRPAEAELRAERDPVAGVDADPATRAAHSRRRA